jgi:hypothetical protein
MEECSLLEFGRTTGKEKNQHFTAANLVVASAWREIIRSSSHIIGANNLASPLVHGRLLGEDILQLQ